MTDDKFITFQKFNSAEDAKELISTLKDNGLNVQIEDASPSVDLTFSGNTLQNEIRVKVKQIDFETANQILEKKAKQLIDKFPDDHYLYEFTDDELIEIIEKPDEWSKEDYLLSQKILKDKGLEINKDKVEELRQKRIDDLRKPEKVHTGWIIFGFISTLFGGLLGIFIGWFYLTFKKTDPTGQRFYAYDQKTRIRGQQIFWLGLISLIIWIISWMFRF